MINNDRDAMTPPGDDYPECIKAAIIEAQIKMASLPGYKEVCDYVAREFGGGLTRNNMDKLTERLKKVLGVDDHEVLNTPIIELLRRMKENERLSDHG